MHLFHTSPAHVARFDALRDRIAPGLALSHHIRTDWLDRARAGGLTSPLVAEITRTIAAAQGARLCTCTTIGAVAEAAGATRIDRPLMQAAARLGVPVCLAFCLDSTAGASTGLLRDCIAKEATAVPVSTLSLTRCWPLFESGDHAGFAGAIADAIRAHVATRPDIGCVVLAQASMADAAGRLTDLGLPVLTAPERAFRAALGAA